MKEKFKTVPLDPDTFILEQKEIKIGKLDALHQKWRWSGIKGESLIFICEEVAELKEEHLVEECRKSGLIRLDSSTTFKRAASGFTFVNFNFDS